MLRRVCHPAPRWPNDRARRRRTLIRLTPLIDVVFILLVFFMLATSFRDWRSIDLAATAGTSVAVDEMKGAVLVEVRRDGLRLSAVPVAFEALAERLEKRMAERPDLRVLIKPAPGVALQETVRVLDALSEAGISRLSLVPSR